jgi:hypothetical protein
MVVKRVLYFTACILFARISLLASSSSKVRKSQFIGEGAQATRIRESSVECPIIMIANRLSKSSV